MKEVQELLVEAVGWEDEVLQRVSSIKQAMHDGAVNSHPSASWL